MKIQEEMHGKVAVLKVTGTLFNSPKESLLLVYIKRLVANGVVELVVDFQDMKWFGSRIMRVLMAGIKHTRNAGGSLRLSGISGKQKEILAAARLGLIFQTFDTIQKALNSFEKSDSVQVCSTACKDNFSEMVINV